MRIVVDAGHGGHDPGAVNLNVGAQEKAFNLQIAIALQSWLLQAAHSPRMTRDDDRFITLSGRVALAKAYRADAFISVHCNAVLNRVPSGTEVWTSPGKTRADALATAIGESMAANLPASPLRPDWSDGDLDKEGRLYVLTMTTCPAVLVECGFVSNDDEAGRLKDPATIQAIAQAIAQGISMWAATR